LLRKAEVAKIRNKGMKLIPWTVNEVADMRKLKSWGVDGLITDYPDRQKPCNTNLTIVIWFDYYF
jgi:glycerophosphoryl diester phosphodiesterase